MEINQTQAQTQTQTQTPYQVHLEKIIRSFPMYYKIFEKYYSGEKDTTYSLNRIYQSLFGGIVEFYQEFMLDGINEIINQVKQRYNPDKFYAIIDYVEYLFGNILYETFLFELNKLNLPEEQIGYEYLCVFEYIIRVELTKYKLYLDVIKQIEPESKLMVAFECRISNLFKKISFALGRLKKSYPSQIEIYELCCKIIADSGFDFENKIDLTIAHSINSFIHINKFGN